MTFGRVLLGTLTAVSLALWPALPAHAHASAIASWPAVGQALTEAPGRVTIEFDTELSPVVLIAVVDPAGTSLIDGEPVVQGTYLTVALLPSQEPGAYTASFHVIGTDEHEIIGRVDFTVDPAGVATVNPAGDPPDLGLDGPEVATPDADAEEAGSGSGPLVLLAGFGGVVLLIVVLRLTSRE